MKIQANSEYESEFVSEPSSNFDMFLFILGLAALFCLSPAGASVAVISMMIIIGIPLTLVMYIIPLVFIFLLLGRLSHFGLKRVGVTSWLLSFIVAAGILAAVPFLANLRLDAMATRLVSGDLNNITKPIPVETIAIVSKKNGVRSVDCGDFCQRALLKGEVKNIILASVKTLPDSPIGELKGRSYRLKKRATCPNYVLKSGRRSLKIAGEKRKRGDKSPADIIRIKAARGLCFIEENAQLSQADAIIIHGGIKRGKSSYNAGYDIFADTISASRISYYVRKNNEFKKTFQETGVTIRRLLPVLMPSYLSSGLSFKGGFIRRSTYRGNVRRYSAALPLGPFLQDTLGYDLSLDDTGASEEVVAIIADRLNKPGNVDATVIKIIESFFKNFNQQKNATEEAFVLALRVLSDERISTPQYINVPIRKIASTDKVLAGKFARVLFSRLFKADPTLRKDIPNYIGARLGYLSSAIASLPDEAILPYREQLEKLSIDPVRRVIAYRALMKLKAFGASSVPTLIYLIDNANNYKGKKGHGGNNWQHPYLAGAQGLCLLGEKGSIAIPLIYRRLDSGVMVKHGSYWKMTINTLVSLGAKPDDMWPHLQTNNKNHSRKRFDYWVNRASKKISCSY